MSNTVLTNIDPQEYFDYVKSKKVEVTDEYLKAFYSVTQVELEKAMKTNQVAMVRKLAFMLDMLPREYELIKRGINTFIYLDDIQYYIKSVADKAVKIIELDEYPRSLPDEITEMLVDFKSANLFDRFYVLFTDYTDDVTRTVEAERKRKDPILFGTFEYQTRRNWVIHDRFYYIADWEDEYCDLTLCKMISAMSKEKKNIEHDVFSPIEVTAEKVKSYLHALELKSENHLIANKQREPWYSKLNFFKRK